MRRASLPFLFLLSSLAAACGDDPSLAGDVVGVTVADPGHAVPEGGARIELIWLVTSGSPDYEWVAGSGRAHRTGFELDLPDALPEAARNRYGDVEVGVGAIFATQSEEGFGPGRLEEEDIGDDDVLLGATPRHAIIYRNGVDASPDIPEDDWVFDFPEGFSCGVAVPAAEGETFDGFAPIDCSEVELRFGDLEEFDWVNWT
ncbi:MAG TPA: hypothetical protein RMH85_20900 [Polyangiaceae bacterium LLY-WYZ-15_(1-7)]|nr:hypothetical protein [Polyangiaceae bacterium LLY-WYZ-15_(1-7)]HJL02679.1 hypothetical protein [Polyangiaceae bacterium LLY-WYZ-15_(1-7)]HJL10946.1 hypothetical protein [Polyangiaceae bacterium LLY-WYZ-15_(1-7)]HJL26289.1 hypothetical protein [Polyangiaceae bacterium LLY-WYZ-15_(1-7)]HJL33649.1 hypothetical protein [Polyangiaceae bacterium LLY-WYZ-15_(1-7)]